LAELLNVSTRTLRRRRVRARGQCPVARAAHRPLTALPSRALLRTAVRAWHELAPGHDGFRSLRAALKREGLKLAPRLSQRLVSALKRKRARRERRRVEHGRVKVEVLARNVMWSSDESFLERDLQGEVRSSVVRETLVPKTLAVAIGPPATEDDVMRLWECARTERGCWPLVISLDNGGAFRSALVQEFLHERQIIALYNLPRTPQHNPFVERAIGELKCVIGQDGLAERGGDPSQARVCAPDPGVRATRMCKLARLLCSWNNAAWRLDHLTPRADLAGLTPDEVDGIAPQAEDLVGRERFYNAVRAALTRVAQEQLKPRARRRAEREAIICKLQEHGLVNRTRGGGRSSRPSKRTRVA